MNHRVIFSEQALVKFTFSSKQLSFFLLTEFKRKQISFHHFEDPEVLRTYLLSPPLSLFEFLINFNR